jgi:excinuclease UvrABC ATPase subunit
MKASSPTCGGATESTSDYVRDKLEEFMVNRPCRACGGSRLQPVALAVDIGRSHHQPTSPAARWLNLLPWAEAAAR